MKIKVINIQHNVYKSLKIRSSRKKTSGHAPFAPGSSWQPSRPCPCWEPDRTDFSKRAACPLALGHPPRPGRRSPGMDVLPSVPSPLTCFLSVASDPKPEGRRPVWRKLCGQAPSTDTAEGADSGPGGRWSMARRSAQPPLGMPAAAPSQTSGQKAPHFPSVSVSAPFILHTTCTQSL